MNAPIHLGFAPQPGPQEAFLQSPCDITVYGGARGGGKTYASLGEWWLHSDRHGEAARGLMIRKTREALKDTISIAISMFGPAASYVEQGKFFRMANGARLYMAYLEREADAENYQGWSLTRVYVEELTQFHSPEAVMRLLATLRSATGIACQMRCTCNPGGPGHNWVKTWMIDQGPYRVITDPDTGLQRVFIPALLTDNPALLASDPKYIDRLRSVGSPQLVQAWLEGNWDIVEGAFFPEFDRKRHVIQPFTIPERWTRFRAMDWGSARPFSVGWYCVVQDDHFHDGRVMPRNAIIRYREYYGCSKPNVGLKMTAEEVAKEIVSRETGEDIIYGVLDPAAFNVVSGPSIGETLLRGGAVFRRADNIRVSHDRRMGGWDQVRNRLKGDGDGRAMVYFFATNYHLLRTLPVMQHDELHLEDMDTEGEDHASDELRYACMSRPFLAPLLEDDDRNPFLVANAFKLRSLHD